MFQSDAFKKQYEILVEKIDDLARRLHIDIDSEDGLDRLISVGHGAKTYEGLPNKDWEEACWEFRIFAVAFMGMFEFPLYKSDPDALITSLCLSNWAVGFLEGIPGAGDDLGALNSRLAASSLARLRHAENRALINDAVKHWRENIDPKLSAQKAATELIKIVPLSHKKLAEIISKAKRGFFDD